MKSDDKISIEVTPVGAELTIREGQALTLREPQIVSLSGILSSPLDWLNSRIDTIDQKQARLVVNREKLTLKLTINETSHYATSVTGSLELHPYVERFGINSGKYSTNFEMAQLFKMNRSVFENIDVAMKLVSELQNFRAKVDREVEKSNDNRGNKRDLLAQVVESNLPETFKLTMPIFKGTKPQTFPVEVYIRAEDFSCTLVSPVANDLIEEMRNQEIDRVLDSIRELAPDLVIIEQ